MTKPKIAVSSCLLGQRVRYDGTDKQETYITDTLAPHAELIAICPEVAIGLGTPRETIALVGLQNPQALGTQTPGHDVTHQLTAYASSLKSTLEALCGYIVKARSPSCGWQSAKVLDNPQGKVIGKHSGLFINQVHQQIPWLPIIDEEGTNTSETLYHFLENVFAISHWHNLCVETITLGHLMKFHASYKYMIMARSPVIYRELGQYVAQCRKETLQTQSRKYFLRLISALHITPSRKNHCNVLQHLMGYFKKNLSQTQRTELVQAIHQYQHKDAPLTHPRSLLRNYLKLYPNDYLQHQAYLFPFPDELCP